jgi:hypothetical protein
MLPASLTSRLTRLRKQYGKRYQKNIKNRNFLREAALTLKQRRLREIQLASGNFAKADTIPSAHLKTIRN